jgi:hypothetical protein
MVKVIQKVEPTCFKQAIWNPKWDNAMDEEMLAKRQGVGVHSLVHNTLGVEGCARASRWGLG